MTNTFGSEYVYYKPFVVEVIINSVLGWGRGLFTLKCSSLDAFDSSLRSEMPTS